MLCTDPGVLAPSDYYFATPLLTAKNLFYHLLSVGEFFANRAIMSSGSAPPRSNPSQQQTRLPAESRVRRVFFVQSPITLTINRRVRGPSNSQK